MKVVRSRIPEVLIVEPAVHVDGRGLFLETYHAERYREHGIVGPFVQDNQSRSTGGTLRGLHLQVRRPQGKLVRVIEGAIFDVAADVRRGSPTFGQWIGVTLTAENFKQCYIPPGFAHGFCVLSPVAQVEYKCTDVYDPGGESGVIWNDPTLGITWPIDQPTLSARDQQLPPLADILDTLAPYRTEP
ncbi:MAG TPA: dTDP-4-dehydrorhamnose 3,5-epimerase [Vicinamibacterales bacterium]